MAFRNRLCVFLTLFQARCIANAAHKDEIMMQLGGASSCSEESDGKSASEHMESLTRSFNCDSHSNCLAQLGCLFERWYPDVEKGFSGETSLGRAGTYGEITLAGAAKVFDSMSVLGAALGPGDAFFDLGSGLGKMVLQAYLTTRVGKAVGVELDPMRHGLAADARNSLLGSLKPSIGDHVSQPAHLNFIQGDVLDATIWSDASAVYGSFLCFPADILLEMTWLLGANLQPGAVLFSLVTLPGCHRGLHYIGSMDASMTWRSDFQMHVYVVPPLILAPPQWLSVHENTWESATRKEFEALTGASLQDYAVSAFEVWHCKNQSCGELALRRAFRSVLLHPEKITKKITSEAEDSATAILARVISVAMDKIHGGFASVSKCFVEELAAAVAADGKSVGPVSMKLVDSIHDLGLDGENVIHVSAQSYFPSADAMRLLLERGADTNKHDNVGRSPVSYAAQMGHVELVKLMLQYRADANVADTPSQSTPLHHALIFSKSEVVKLLLESRAIVNAVDSEGKSPLQRLNHRHVDLAQKLCEYRADVHMPDNGGKTMLHHVAGMGSEPMLKKLLELHASVNVADKMGHTPLHSTVPRSLPNIAMILLQERANIEAMQRGGATPLSQAAQFGHDEMADLLISHRASPVLKDTAGLTPMQYAKTSGHESLLAILQEALPGASEL